MGCSLVLWLCRGVHILPRHNGCETAGKLLQHGRSRLFVREVTRSKKRAQQGLHVGNTAADEVGNALTGFGLTAAVPCTDCTPKRQSASFAIPRPDDDLYDPATNHIITAASCTTNCLAPVVKVLHEQIGIERGALTTIHDVTNTQVIVDAPHKDLRRARSALNSLIPTSTGSATAISMIYPELAGKLNGSAVRVPLLNASLTDAVFTMSRDVTVEEVNGLFLEASRGELAGILGFEHRPLVSADYTNDTRSGIVDGPSTMVIDGCMLKVLVWYDNEYGYAFRMADLATKVAAAL